LHELNELVAELQSSELIGTAEVARRLDVTPEEVREWAAGCILPCQKVSGRLVFKLADIVRWQLEGIERLSAPTDLSGELLGSAKGIG